MSARTLAAAVSLCLGFAAAMLPGTGAARDFTSVTNSERWTNVSGVAGRFFEARAGNDGGLFAIEVNERTDDPIEFRAYENTLSSSSPNQSNVHDFKLDEKFPTGISKVSVGADHYITAVQVCVKSDKIKGLRVWGKMLGTDGKPKNETDDSFTLPNCYAGKWYDKIECGPEKVVTGLRAHYTEWFKGFSGISLRCAKLQ